MVTPTCPAEMGGSSKTWRRLKGENRLPMLLAGITLTDGVAATAPDHRAA